MFRTFHILTFYENVKREGPICFQLKTIGGSPFAGGGRGLKPQAPRKPAQSGPTPLSNIPKSLLRECRFVGTQWSKLSIWSTPPNVNHNYCRGGEHITNLETFWVIKKENSTWRNYKLLNSRRNQKLINQLFFHEEQIFLKNLITKEQRPSLKIFLNKQSTVFLWKLFLSL